MNAFLASPIGVSQGESNLISDLAPAIPVQTEVAGGMPIFLDPIAPRSVSAIAMGLGGLGTITMDSFPAARSFDIVVEMATPHANTHSEVVVRTWAIVALIGIFIGIVGAGLSLMPSYRDAAILVPVGCLVWWAVGQFGPKPPPVG